MLGYVIGHSCRDDARSSGVKGGMNFAGQTKLRQGRWRGCDGGVHSWMTPKDRAQRTFQEENATLLRNAGN